MLEERHPYHALIVVIVLGGGRLRRRSWRRRLGGNRSRYIRTARLRSIGLGVRVAAVIVRIVDRMRRRVRNSL
jgi:hypothetical protein